MTVLDDRLPAAVDKILLALGKPVTLRTYPSQTIDAVSGAITRGAAVEYVVQASPPKRSILEAVEGVGMRADQVELMIGNNGLLFIPSAGQELLFDALHFHVLRAVPHYSGENILRWDIFGVALSQDLAILGRSAVEDGQGGFEPVTYPDVGTVDGVLEEDLVTPTLEAGRVDSRRLANALLMDTVGLTTHHRIRDPDGAVWRITGLGRSESLRQVRLAGI